MNPGRRCGWQRRQFSIERSGAPLAAERVAVDMAASKNPMGEEFRSILLGTAGLSVAAAIAAWLTFSRGFPVVGSIRLRVALVLAVIALLSQSGHFAEELVTGFPQRFPALLGLAPWSIRFFVSFNVFWIVVWGFSCWGVMAGRRAALFPLWFLAIASLANGVAHPLLSALTGGYFPGLFTSPLVGVVGFALVRQLLLVTGDRVLDPGAA